MFRMLQPAACGHGIKTTFRIDPYEPYHDRLKKALPYNRSWLGS